MNTPQQKQYKVLLIGDSCIDEYVYGTCDRLSPEAPVPILKYMRKEKRDGMAWNVYNNLKAFGLEVYIITNKEKIIKTRYIDEKINQQILRVDSNDSCEPMDCQIPYEQYDAVVISDYNKGFVTSSKIFEIVSNTKCPVFIDSKKTVLPEYGCYIKINNHEYDKLDDGNKKNSNNIIITYGDMGAKYHEVMYLGEKVKVYDVVGAGDTFLSGLVYFYLKYGIIEKAIPYANKSASIAVQNRGTYVLTKNDINKICS